MPPEIQLGQEFGVSRATVRQAIDLLAREGMVRRIKGRGTFVNRPKYMQNLWPSNYPESLTSDDLPLPVVKVLSFSKVHLSPSLAASLRIDQGDEVYELTRLWFDNDEPIILMTSWLPTERLPKFSAEPFQGDRYRSMHEVLPELGVQIGRSHKEISLTIVDEEEAPLLESEPGSPALLVTYVNETTEGVPIELRRWVIRGDRCNIYIDIPGPDQLI
jgi:GntR family transcriptional regulator